MPYSPFQQACLDARDAADALNGRTVANPGGASRWYVSFEGKVTAAMARAIQSAGFKWFQRPGSSRRHIYVGYCNFSGPEPVKAETIAATFRVAGFPAYASDDQD